MSDSEPLAFLGGTFDPVHYGHLRCAEEVRTLLGLNTLYLLPAGKPVHRTRPSASNTQRLEMLRLSLQEFPGLAVDSRELDREGPSYMVETLEEMRSQWPQRPLLLLLGQDAANQLNSWHRWQDLFDLTHIIVLSRPHSKASYSSDLANIISRHQTDDPAELRRSAAACVLPLQVTAVDVCATTIKSMIQLGRSPRAMLAPPVMAYIEQQGLYSVSK